MRPARNPTLEAIWAGAVPIVASCIMSLIVGWFWTRPAYVIASDTWFRYTSGFTAESVLDQSERSVWMAGSLPAYVEIDLRGRHPIRRIAVRNSDDFPHHDVWSMDFVVQLFDGDAEVFVERRRFASPTAQEWFDVDAVGDRIRVTVETSNETRGCLADVSWE